MDRPLIVNQMDKQLATKPPARFHLTRQQYENYRRFVTWVKSWGGGNPDWHYRKYKGIPIQVHEASAKRSPRPVTRGAVNTNSRSEVGQSQ